MADTSTIASLATAAGTLVLALATFSSTRSANRAARISEQSLKLYLAIPLRNVAAGLAVLHGWHIWPLGAVRDAPVAAEEFRRLQRDLYVPAGDVSFWQAAVRDPAEPLYQPLRDAIRERSALSVDILYGDHEGGQRTITRFHLSPRHNGGEEESWLWLCSTSRHWNLDREDPR